MTYYRGRCEIRHRKAVDNYGVIQDFALLLLFMSMGETLSVSELRTPTGILFISQIIHEYGQPWWNDIDRIKPKNSEKNLSQFHFVQYKSYIDWPGSELGSPGLKQSIRRQSSLEQGAIPM
jgi:hypothetical protein